MDFSLQFLALVETLFQSLSGWNWFNIFLVLWWCYITNILVPPCTYNFYLWFYSSYSTYLWITSYIHWGLITCLQWLSTSQILSSQEVIPNLYGWQSNLIPVTFTSVLLSHPLLSVYCNIISRNFYNFEL